MDTLTITTSGQISTRSQSSWKSAGLVMAAASLAQAPWPIESLQNPYQAIHGWAREPTDSIGTYQTTALSSLPAGMSLTHLLTSLYQELSHSQVDLDPEMADILYANLWDLYE